MVTNFSGASLSCVLLRGLLMCSRASCLGVSPGKMGAICRGVVPSNTKKATSWAVRVFEEWRRERNATATGEQCPLELLEKLTGCRSVTLPSPRHEQPKMSPYSSSTHDEEAPQKLLRVVVYTTLSRALGVQGIYRASISNICSAVAGTAYVVCAEPFILWLPRLQ